MVRSIENGEGRAHFKYRVRRMIKILDLRPRIFQRGGVLQDQRNYREDVSSDQIYLLLFLFSTSFFTLNTKCNISQNILNFYIPLPLQYFKHFQYFPKHFNKIKLPNKFQSCSSFFKQKHWSSDNNSTIFYLRPNSKIDIKFLP